MGCFQITPYRKIELNSTTLSSTAYLKKSNKKRIQNRIELQRIAVRLRHFTQRMEKSEGCGKSLMV